MLAQRLHGAPTRAALRAIQRSDRGKLRPRTDLPDRPQWIRASHPRRGHALGWAFSGSSSTTSTLRTAGTNVANSTRRRGGHGTMYWGLHSIVRQWLVGGRIRTTCSHRLSASSSTRRLRPCTKRVGAPPSNAPSHNKFQSDRGSLLASTLGASAAVGGPCHAAERPVRYAAGMSHELGSYRSHR